MLLRFQTMTDDPRRLLDAAMQLTPRERANLAAQLLATLDDGEPEADWENVWAAELTRRISEAEASETWETVLARLRNGR